jgi:hypothetical protein
MPRHQPQRQDSSTRRPCWFDEVATRPAVMRGVEALATSASRCQVYLAQDESLRRRMAIEE